MEFVIVGGHHNGKRICMNEPVPVRLTEDVDISCGTGTPDLITVNEHEYVPQSFNFDFYGERHYVLVPNGQELPEMLRILIDQHGEK